MKVFQYQCVCPMCRVDFTAFCIDRLTPPADEVAYDRKSLLCDICERRWVNALFRSFKREGGFPGGITIDPVRLSAMLDATHGSDQHGSAAASVPNAADGLSGSLSILPNVPIAGGIPAADSSGRAANGGTGGGPHPLPAHDPT